MTFSGFAFLFLWIRVVVALSRGVIMAEAKLIALPIQKFPGNPVVEDRLLQQRRSQSIKNKAPLTFFGEAYDHDVLFRGLGTHYVTLYVGCNDNPQPQTVIVDTGSSRTGFPCSPSCTGQCGQGHHLHPLYDETLSECLEVVTEADCTTNQFQNGQCRASAYYAEGSGWEGFQVMDTVRIGSDSAQEDAATIEFTCQDFISNLFLTQLADGITGLSKSSRSLANQLYNQGTIDRQQFSLCVLNEQNAQSNAGMLVLGGTDARLHNSPMVYAMERGSSWSSFWRVKIEKIYGVVGEDVLSSSSWVNGEAAWTVDEWATASLEDISVSNLLPIVDSGTTDTYFHYSLEAPMRDIWNQLTNTNGISFDAFSYRSDVVDQLPTFIFQLQGTGDNDLDLPTVIQDPDFQFQGLDSILVAFPPSAYLQLRSSSYRRRFYFDSGRPVLGANWLSGKNVLFDQENNRIGFSMSDCILNEGDTFPPTETASDPPTLFPTTTFSPTSTPQQRGTGDDGSSLSCRWSVYMGVWSSSLLMLCFGLLS